MSYNLFKEFIFLSKKIREEYPMSLGEKNSNWEEVCRSIDVDIPVLFQAIYSRVSGTKKDIKQQQLMDFIPGYQLIHISELVNENIKFNNVYGFNNDFKDLKLIPFLTNYSSDFVCYGKMNDGREVVGTIMHDDQQFTPMHDSVEKFFETICEFYKKDVYFLDADGYLDYDFEQEGVIGAEINPSIDYWLG